MSTQSVMCPQCQGTGKKKISATQSVDCAMCKGTGKVAYPT